MDSKQMKKNDDAPKILIIGASGFVGANLLKALESEGLPCRAMSRDPSKILSTSPLTSKVRGDLEDQTSLVEALEGIETIYYLAHSLDTSSAHFMERERQQAQNLAELVNDSHRIIYLGGIVPDSHMSPHLESRKSVGEVFQKTKAKTIEFRASIIIGRGSASYEIARALITRLPFIMTTDWSKSICQPIALKDVISYLSLAQTVKLRKKHSVFEIGGSERIKYEDILKLYAKEKELFRPEVHISKLPLPMAKEILKVIVPEYAEVGSKLLDSISANTVARNEEALKVFDITPLSFTSAVELTDDGKLSDTNFSETLERLKAHKELPSYLSGQTLQASFDFSGNKSLNELITGLNKALPFGSKIKSRLADKNELNLKLPLIGEIKIAKMGSHSLLFAYRPKFFFQAGTWAVFNKLISETKKRL